MPFNIGRRELIAALGSAAAWPHAALAQQGERVRRIGWLDQYDQGAPEAQAIRKAQREALADLGWIEGRNLKTDERFAAADLNQIRAYAVELVALAPDVLVTPSAVSTRALQRATQTIPIVFTGGGDATANGLVRNITRPEGNTTGFSGGDPTTAGKRLELLKEAAPFISRVLIVFKPEVAPTAPNYIASIEAAARALAVETVKLPFRDAVDLVHSIDAFAAKPNGGLLMLPPSLRGSPKMPRTVGCGRKPGNEYVSHSRRLRFDGRAIHHLCQIPRPAGTQNPYVICGFVSPSASKIAHSIPQRPNFDMYPRSGPMISFYFQCLARRREAFPAGPRWAEAVGRSFDHSSAKHVASAEYRARAR